MPRPVGQATLRERRDIAPTLAIFRFALEQEAPAFAAGQFLTLGTPPDDTGLSTWRAYSIASAPGDPLLELFVRRPDPPGRLTGALWSLEPGASLPHRGIAGAFTVEDTRADGSPDERELLLLGAGTGVAPLVSIARDLARRGWPRAVVLAHGASLVPDLAYDAQLRAMATASGGRLRYVPTISRPQDPACRGWAGETGRVESLLAGGASRLEALLGEPLEPARFFAFACGFDATVAALQEGLAARGFERRRDMKAESFG